MRLRPEQEIAPFPLCTVYHQPEAVVDQNRRDQNPDLPLLTDEIKRQLRREEINVLDVCLPAQVVAQKKDRQEEEQERKRTEDHAFQKRQG
jgi:hypothetical protein